MDEDVSDFFDVIYFVVCSVKCRSWRHSLTCVSALIDLILKRRVQKLFLNLYDFANVAASALPSCLLVTCHRDLDSPDPVNMMWESFMPVCLRTCQWARLRSLRWLWGGQSYMIHRVRSMWRRQCILGRLAYVVDIVDNILWVLTRYLAVQHFK